MEDQRKINGLYMWSRKDMRELNVNQKDKIDKLARRVKTKKSVSI